MQDRKCHQLPNKVCPLRGHGYSGLGGRHESLLSPKKIVCSKYHHLSQFPKRCNILVIVPEAQKGQIVAVTANMLAYCFNGWVELLRTFAGEEFPSSNGVTSKSPDEKVSEDLF